MAAWKNKSTRARAVDLKAPTHFSGQKKKGTAEASQQGFIDGKPLDYNTVRKYMQIGIVFEGISEAQQKMLQDAVRKNMKLSPAE